MIKYTFMKLKTPKELGITRTQFRNIARLCLFVKDKVPPPQFDITDFYLEEGQEECQVNPSGAKYSCGSSACFLGYAPLAGIRAAKREEWVEYSDRVLGTKGYFGDLFELLFHGKHKNCRTAAVRRGAYYLVHGIPTSGDLRIWEAPKSFRPPWKLIAAAAA